jgi:integrase
MGIKVKLRQKKISGNRHSLYLDYWPEILHPKTGKKTRREFLGSYIYDNPKSAIDKQHNKETLQLAEQIRQKRDYSVNKPEIYTDYEKEQLRIKELGETNFVEYFKKQTDLRTSSNYGGWLSAYNYLKDFTNGSVKFSELNESFFNDFRRHLLTTKSLKSDKTILAQNSAVSYFNKIKATLKQAFKDGIIQVDINGRVDPIKTADTERNVLTIEELNKLIKTHCNNKLLKNAAIFSSLTGLRFSDIKKLTWKELEFIEGQGYIIKFTQQKTKGVEVLPIPDQAFSLLGEPRDPEDLVFEGLNYSAYENKHLYQWIGAAGITKDITFHCFRHTYATLQLSQGTDLYTVSKMLGHRSIRTTQIYAKVMDKAKREASGRIKLDM